MPRIRLVDHICSQLVLLNGKYLGHLSFLLRQNEVCDRVMDKNCEYFSFKDLKSMIEYPTPFMDE